MNRQELIESAKAFGYEVFDKMEHEPANCQDLVFFDVVTFLIHAYMRSEFGDDILNKRVLTMTPDEFVNYLVDAITVKGEFLDVIEFIEE